MGVNGSEKLVLQRSPVQQLLVSRGGGDVKFTEKMLRNTLPDPFIQSFMYAFKFDYLLRSSVEIAPNIREM